MDLSKRGTIIAIAVTFHSHSLSEWTVLSCGFRNRLEWFDVRNFQKEVIEYQSMTAHSFIYRIGFYEEWDKISFSKLISEQLFQNKISYYSVALLCLVLVSILCSFRLKSSSSKVKLDIFCQPSTFNLSAKNRIETNVGPYQPPFWYSPLLGTMVPFGHDPTVSYERELFSDPNVQFVVDWFPQRPPASSSELNSNVNVIFFFPGLGLTSNNVSFLGCMLMIVC